MGMTYQIECPTANTAVTIAITSDSPCNQYMLGNHDNNKHPVYVRISESNVAASLPTSAGAYSLLVPGDWIQIVTGPQVNPNKIVYVSAIGENNDVEVYITPGEGL